MSDTLLGPLLERVQGLFVDSYDKQSLRELLRFRMNQTLANEVSDGAAFPTVVFDLMEKAKREGWLLDLAREARDRRRGRPEWDGVVRELEAALGHRAVRPGAPPHGTGPAPVTGAGSSEGEIERSLSALAPGELARFVLLLEESPDQIEASAGEPLSGSVLVRWARDRHRLPDLQAVLVTQARGTI